MPELARFAVVAQRGDFEQKVTSTGARGRSGQMATGHRRRDERERGSQRNEGEGQERDEVGNLGAEAGGLKTYRLKT